MDKCKTLIGGRAEGASAAAMAAAPEFDRCSVTALAPAKVGRCRFNR